MDEYNVFDDDENLNEAELETEQLSNVFEYYGFNKQLYELSLACSHLVSGATKIKENGPNSNEGTHMDKLVKNMGYIYALIETFMAFDQDVNDIVLQVKDFYIKQEVSKIIDSTIDLSELKVVDYKDINRPRKYFNGED